MPMPVSLTANAIVRSGPALTRSDTLPLSVNLSAFENKFFKICPRR